jgi:hypothetical protein
MVGLAGCSDSVTIKTGSDDENTNENNGSTETPDIDTAGFSFSYDETAKQARIEFTGGAAIDAGNVQIRHDAGREVLWAELGSTIAGPREDIEAGATAVLGPEILNWEAPIGGGETIRLIYTGKETPATLERYTPPGETDIGTTVPASISGFSIDASSNQQLRISFISDKQLETAEVTITGAEPHSLTLTDFTDQQTGSESYQYEATVTVGSYGVYRATLEGATDINGRDSTSGQRITDTTDLTSSTEDTTPPRIDAFSISSPSSQGIRVSFESSERLTIIEVDVSGSDSFSLSRAAFSETEAGGAYSYEATAEINSSGSYTATLNQAIDQSDNDGAEGQSVSVSVGSPPGQSQLEAPFTETFDSGIGDWTVDQRFRLPEQGPNPGDGGYSDQYGGSVRLRVDGGPSTIGVGHPTTGIDAGTTISTTVQIEASGSQPGNISLALFAPDSDDEVDARFTNDGNVTSGEIEINGTVEEDYPEGTEIRVWADVWPGEFTAYVTEIGAGSEQSNTTSDVLDDFEDTSQLDWEITDGGRSNLTFSDESARGSHSLYFEDSSNRIIIRKSMGDISKPQLLSYWFKYQSQNDNNFRISLLGNNNMKLIEIREYNQTVHYKNRRTPGVLNNPIADISQNVWYQVELSNIDFESGTLDINITAIGGETIGSVTDISFWDEIEKVDDIRIVNSLESRSDGPGLADPLWIDHIIRK